MLGSQAQRYRHRNDVCQDSCNDREEERKSICIEHPVVAEQVGVVGEAHELPLAVAGIVREAEEEADQHRNGVEGKEGDQCGPNHPVVRGWCTAFSHPGDRHCAAGLGRRGSRGSQL